MKRPIYSFIIVIFSLLCSILTENYLLGFLTISCGLLNCYYAAIGKVYNYIYGALYCLLSGYISYQNGLYGIAMLSLLIYFPSQIQGFISWNHQKDHNYVVNIRKFTFKNSLLIITICLISSILFGFLLTQIPQQQLAFLDSTSNILNLCGIILMNLRYQECWFIWLFNNTIDLTIWFINFFHHRPNSNTMLIVSFGYLIINIYGLIKWYQLSKKISKYSV